MTTATAENSLFACRTCGLAHRYSEPREGWLAECRRCGSTLERRTWASLQLSAAFTLSALLLYFPANAFPIMRMNLYGTSTDATIWQGCLRLYQEGDAFIALVVFLASVLIPLLKLVGLLCLIVTTRYASHHLSRTPNGLKWMRVRTRALLLIEILGRWAMLDVFVLAALVSIVKLNRMATVVPGPGAAAFVGVVIFTILASASFDPQLIWNPKRTQLQKA